MSVLGKIKAAFAPIMLPVSDKNDVDALQSFAITMAIAFPVIFMGVLPWFFGHSMPLWPMVLSLLLMLLHIFWTTALYWPYYVWMVIASVLGWINTKIILAFAYALLIVPTGLIMKALNKLQYKSIASDQSAWIPREKKPNKDNLKEPF
jgi:predicted membrane protein